MNKYLIHNGLIIKGDKTEKGSIEITNNLISNLYYYSELSISAEDFLSSFREKHPDYQIIDTSNKYILAGGIDAHVHFRDPGLTSKGDISSESRAALLGGVTSFIDMPNTNPVCITPESLVEKIKIAEQASSINYAFHLGASNDNSAIIDDVLEGRSEILKKEDFGAVKVFMGSSTGNMLVNDDQTLDHLFEIKSKSVLVHCEVEKIIQKNTQDAIAQYGDEIPIKEHPNIRSRKACILSSINALERAMKKGTRLHLLHISTKEEIEMVKAAKLQNPNIFAETSTNYLWFSDKDYDRLGTKLKCNPAIKSEEDCIALKRAIKEGVIDSIGTDHAPHLEAEKDNPYTKAPSGLPTIGESLGVLWRIFKEEDIELNILAKIFSENIAASLGIDKRGRLEKGNYADIIVVKDDEHIVKRESLAYKCGWSPYEGVELPISVEYAFINGTLAVEEGKTTNINAAKALYFNK